MDLSTKYLGIDLPHPFMPGASPLVDDLDTVKRLEDAGAAAIVMDSLFEEQVVYEQEAAAHFMEEPAYSFAEAQTYFPDPEPPSTTTVSPSRISRVSPRSTCLSQEDLCKSTYRMKWSFMTGRT